MVTLGAVFRPQLPPERLRAVAQAADEAGLEGFVRFAAERVRPLL